MKSLIVSIVVVSVAFFLLVALACNVAFAQVCLSSSPNTSNTASVTPNYNTGDTLLLISSAFVGDNVLPSFTGSPVVGAGYSNANTGSIAMAYIRNAPAGLGPLSVAWSADGDLAPTLTVCDLNTVGDILVWGSAGSAGNSVYSLRSGWYQSVRPAVLVYCVGGGLTEVEGWQADSAHGWYTVDGASTDHTFCQFKVTNQPWMGRSKVAWDTPEIWDAYGLISGWVM